MKITRMQTRDFQGLTGEREYLFPEKITVFAAPNGKGKTSILNAIRFGITGDTSRGNLISEGAAKCDVGLDFDGGYQIIRQLPRDGTGKQWFNKRKVNKGECERTLTDRTGIPLNTMQIATASELIGHMKPQAMSDFMLSYIPETLDTATVLSYIPEISFGMKKYAEANLPSGTFGIEELDVFYKKAYDARKIAKKQKTDDEAELRVIGSPEKPAETVEELREQLKRAGEYGAVMAAYKAEKAAYDRAAAQQEKQKALITRLTTAYSAIGDAEYDSEKVTALKKKISDEQSSYNEAYQTAQSLVSAAAALKKALETLDQPICPLSEKLKCATDKSAIRVELTESYRKTAADAKAKSEKVSAIKAAIDSDSAELKELEDAYRKNVEKGGLKRQLEQAKAAITELKEPKVPDAGASVPDEKAVRAKLDAYEALKKAAACKTRLAGETVLVTDLDNLVNAFAPKGIVKQSVTSAYIGAFEASCNVKAGELKKGMRIRFASEGGIIPLLDVKGDGNYLQFSALSGGEKIYLVFILLDMFNQMCGTRMLFLDELSVLDRNNFDTLLDVLEKHTDEYDQIFLTTVDHEGLMDAMKKRGVTAVTAL